MLQLILLFCFGITWRNVSNPSILLPWAFLRHIISGSFNKGGEFQSSTSEQYRGNETWLVLLWAGWLWTACSLIGIQTFCFPLISSQHSKTACSQKVHVKRASTWKHTVFLIKINIYRINYLIYHLYLWNLWKISGRGGNGPLFFNWWDSAEKVLCRWEKQTLFCYLQFET